MWRAGNVVVCAALRGGEFHPHTRHHALRPQTRKHLPHRPRRHSQNRRLRPLSAGTPMYVSKYMCPHATIYLCMCPNICVLMLLYTTTLYTTILPLLGFTSTKGHILTQNLCHHATICHYTNMCPTLTLGDFGLSLRILLYMCPHTTVYYCILIN